MKKVISLFLSVLMVLSLFSCLGVTTFAFNDDVELESVSFEPVEALERYEYTGGSWCYYYDEELEEVVSWYAYDEAFDYWQEGNIITLGYSDGTSEEYVSDGWWFCNEDGEELDEEPLWFYAPDRFVVGENIITVEYDGVTCEISATILESPVESVEFVPVEPVELLQNVDGAYFEPEDGPYAGQDIFFYWGADFYCLGNKFIVTFKDGTEKVYEYSNEDDDFCTEDGEYFDWESFDMLDYQEYEPWLEVGNYSHNMYYMGCPFKLNVTIIENPVAGVEYIPADGYSLIGNFDGDLVECYCDSCFYRGEYFHYDIFNSGFPYDGDVVRVTYKDGAVVDYAYSLDDDWFYDAEGNELPYGADILDEQETDHWTVGTNYFSFVCAGYEAAIPVEVIENPVVGVDVDLGSNATIYELTKGYYEYDEDYEEYFEYDNPLWYDGSKLTVQFADGTEKTYVYDENEEWLVSEDTGAYFPTGIETSDNQKEEHWGIGQHSVTVSTLGYDCELTVRVVANPIESIEFVPAEPITFQAFEDGWWEYYYDEYDEEHEFFYYDTSELTPYSEGNKIVVKYTKGTSDTFVYDEEIGNFVNAKGQQLTKAFDVIYWDVQYYEPWSEESAYNYMVVEFFGRYTYVWVTIENGLPGTPEITGAYNGVGSITVTWEYTPGATKYRVYRRGAGQASWTYLGTTDGNYFEDKFTMGTEKLKDFAYYRYTVRSENSQGYGSFDTDGVVIRYLPPVKNVKATNIVDGVQISWDDYPYSSYMKCIVLRIAAGESEWEILDVAPSSGYVVNDFNVENGKYYRYAVVAGYGDYLSDFNTNLTSLIKYVETPKLTGISNATNGIYIKWNAVAGATGYRVYRRGAGSNIWTYLGTTKNLYYTDTAVKNSSGNYYRYTVRAVSYNTFSGFDTNGLYIKRLASPVITSTKSSSSGITVKWLGVTGAQGYFVYRKTSSSGWTYLGYVTNTSYLDKTASKGVTYTYTVKAVSGKTTSSYIAGTPCKDVY